MSGNMRLAVLAKKYSLSPSEVDVLASSVAVISVMVACADGTIDKKEEKVILKWIKQKQKKDVFWSDFKSLEIDWQQAHSEATEIDTYLSSLTEILNQLADGNKIKRDLLDLAHLVASASGGFLGLGNKIDEDESMVIDLIKQHLLQER